MTKYNFNMETKEGVIALLTSYNYLKMQMYDKSDYEALVVLVDFEKALLESNLTANEILTLSEVFVADKKQVDIAKESGVTKQTIQKRIERASKKIANYYRKGKGRALID